MCYVSYNTGITSRENCQTFVVPVQSPETERARWQVGGFLRDPPPAHTLYPGRTEEPHNGKPEHQTIKKDIRDDPEPRCGLDNSENVKIPLYHYKIVLSGRETNKSFI